MAHFAARPSAPVRVLPVRAQPIRQIATAAGNSRGEKKPAKGKEKAPYQFRPLNEIGAVPKARQRQQAQRQQQEAQKRPKGNGKAKYGGMRQDRHGEWFVLVLADGRWCRVGEMGMRGPG